MSTNWCNVQPDMRAVITFHSIDDQPGPLSFSPRQLEQLLDALSAADIPVLPLDRLMADQSARGVSLTFDDGLSSVHASALPLLRDRGVPAHVFVISRWVGGDNRWPGQPAGATPFSLMNWDQLEELHASGFRIDAHTASHPDLRTLSVSEIEAELEEADSTIEARLGRRPSFFAYPYGFHDARVRAVAARRYAASFTTKLNYLGNRDDRHSLPRLDSHYLRHPRLVAALEGRAAHAYIALRRALRLLRNH